MRTFSDPEKDYIYRIMDEYFDSPQLEKTRDDGEFSIYMVRMQCLLLNEQRYLVLMCARDNFPPSHLKRMREISWVSLQTRILQTEYPDIIRHSYEMKREPVFETSIRIRSRNPTISIYTTDDLPLVVSLIHTRNNEFEYPNEGTLNSALETYRTIVQFNK